MKSVPAVMNELLLPGRVVEGWLHDRCPATPVVQLLLEDSDVTTYGLDKSVVSPLGGV